MNQLARLYWTAKGVGWENLPRRLWQALRLRSGHLHRHLNPSHFADEPFWLECEPSVHAGIEAWQQRAARFFPRPSAYAMASIAGDALWSDRVETVLENALAGQYPMFGRFTCDLSWPPNFNRDGVNGIDWPTGIHWLSVAHSGPPHDDIKLVWEPSRLAAAWLFARAYARTHDDIWAVSFWQMFDAWVAQNPPQMTVAWACGQEMTFRLMAMLFAAITMLDSPAATHRRLNRLTRLAWQTGRHLSINLNQARMQGNNHAISEAVGLWTIGLLFPRFERADRWKSVGARVLASEIRRQVYPDGSYVQHSVNYHRVMMDDLLWACALARRAGTDLPPIVHDRLARAQQWLAQMVDPASGRCPNYGANDGADVLPLSTCDYTDFRPVLQAAGAMLNGQRCVDAGPWDEKMLWLLGEETLDAPVKRPERQAACSLPDGGYYFLRGKRSWAMIRCHSYRHRPSQADMLHLDLWHDGVNILRDGGSYSYWCDRPWKNWFNSTAAHNTLQVDSQDQMIKGPRFLWFRWVRAKAQHCTASPDGHYGTFAGRHFGYRRLPGVGDHVREVLRVGDVYAVRDCLTGRDRHQVLLRWRLAPGPWQPHGKAWFTDIGGEDYALRVVTADCLAVELANGHQSDAPEGWESRYYGERTPAPTLVVAGEDALPISIITLVGPTRQIAELPLDADPMTTRAQDLMPSLSKLIAGNFEPELSRLKDEKRS